MKPINNKKPRKAIVTLPLPLKDLDKLSAVLNKAAEDGYAILASNFIPARDGGMMLYVLGDVSEPASEAIEDSSDLASETPSGHNGSTDLGPGEIVTPET